MRRNYDYSDHQDLEDLMTGQTKEELATARLLLAMGSAGLMLAVLYIMSRVFG